MHIPALRDRRDDIPSLADSFLREFGQTMGTGPAELRLDALEALFNYDWPGNVRELRNVLERATIVCENGQIRPEDLSLRRPVAQATVNRTDLDELERRAIERVMREAEGNKAKASRQLGISRNQLYFRLRKHGLEEIPSRSAGVRAHAG